MVEVQNQNLRAFDFSNGQLHQMQHRYETAEVALEPEVLAAICRRGRRRLRDIQSSCQASLKLDRCRGVLSVTGSKSSIADVKKQLEGLSGPSLTVSPAVWAELMRTRTNPDPTQAAVARIQQETGCRIHIERSIQQVRLFGSKIETAVALNVFKDFERMCVEEVVDLKCLLPSDSETLQTFAQDCGVTLQVEGQRITVLGIQEAVAEAATQLRTYDPVQHPKLRGSNSDVIRMAISIAMSKFAVKEDMSCASTTADSLPPPPIPSQSGKVGDSIMEGLVITKLPPSCPEMKEVQHHSNGRKSQMSTCVTCGSSGQFCVNCGRKMMEYRLAGCPTCGTPKFCVYCGEPTERMKLESTMNLNQAYPQDKYQIYMPNVGLGYNDPQMQVMQMPMQFFQANIQNANQVMMSSEVANPMMAMCVPVSPVSMPTVMLPAPTTGIQGTAMMMPFPSANYE